MMEKRDTFWTARAIAIRRSLLLSAIGKMWLKSTVCFVTPRKIRTVAFAPDTSTALVV